MARKATSGNGNEVNKSEAIREALTANPRAKAGEVVAELKGKGIEVTSGLFYAVKGKMGGGTRKRGRGRGRASRSPAQPVTSSAAANGIAAKPSRANGDVVSTIRQVKALAVEVGGLDRLRELVDALSA